MKTLMIFADGFEDTEGLTTRDVLIRSGIEVTTCSIKDTLSVTTSFKITFNCDTYLSKININDFDAVILPGGKLGVNNMFACELVKNTVVKFAELGKLVCAICAAPSLLTRWGVITSEKYTCYSGFENFSPMNYTGEPVTITGNIITAKSMNYSSLFALEIIEKLLGKEVKERIYKQICSL